MSAADNKALVRRFWEELVGTGEFALAGELLAPGYTVHYAGNPPMDRDGFLQFLGALRSAFPDLAVTVEDLLAEGEEVAVRWSWGGTHQGPFLGIPRPARPSRARGSACSESRTARSWRTSSKRTRSACCSSSGRSRRLGGQRAEAPYRSPAQGPSVMTTERAANPHRATPFASVCPPPDARLRDASVVSHRSTHPSGDIPVARDERAGWRVPGLIVPTRSEARKGLRPVGTRRVNAVSRRLGISTLTSLRLFTRAPCTRIRSWPSATGSAGDRVLVFLALLIVSRPTIPPRVPNRSVDPGEPPAVLGRGRVGPWSPRPPTARRMTELGSYPLVAPASETVQQFLVPASVRNLYSSNFTGSTRGLREVLSLGRTITSP